jgi:hypothetical protein
MGIPRPLLQDIVNTIIDELEDDITTLKQCALVSRLCLPSSRKYLFSSIHLDDETKCQALYEVLNNNSHLARYVRRLHIYCGGRLYQPTHHPYLGFGIEPTPLISLLRIICWVESVTIDWISWPVLPVAFRMALLDILKSPNITHVNFSSTFCFPINSIAELAHIQALSLANMSFEMSSPKPNSLTLERDPRIMVLKTLSFDAVSAVSLAELLRRSMLDISNLRRLLLKDTDTMPSLAVVHKIMHAAAPSLEELIFYTGKIAFLCNQRALITMYIVESMNPRQLDFVLTPNLRAVHVEAPFAWFSSPDPLLWLVDALEGTPGAGILQRIHIVIWFASGSYSCGIIRRAEICEYGVWGDLDRILSSGRFSNLDEVTITLKNPPALLDKDGDAVRRLQIYIEESMPSLRRAGRVLRVV